MRETETFEYIRRKYPDKEETWRKVTRLVKFDENLEVKSVHDFNINCYISTFGRLIRNGILCNMAYGDKYDISSMFTDMDGNQVRFKRHQIVMQTFFMGDRRRYDTVDHIPYMMMEQLLLRHLVFYILRKSTLLFRNVEHVIQINCLKVL